jgi:hypothetical protein
MGNLRRIVDTRAWNSLLDVQLRLKIAIEVVDDRHTPIAPIASHGVSSVVRDMLARVHDEPLRAGIVQATTTHAQEVVIAGDIRIACTPILARGDDVAGVLLVGDSRSPAEALHDIRIVGAGLAGAIQAHVRNGSSGLEPSELDHLSALYRVLGHAVLAGSETEVVRAFVEALAVWHDLESWAYLQDLRGELSLKVSLPGSDRDDVPMLIRSDPFGGAAGAGPRAFDGETLGFKVAERVILLRAQGKNSAPWVVVTRGGESAAPSDARLALYASVLSQMLSDIAAVESSRLTWAILQHLTDKSVSPERAVGHALAELTAMVDAPACFAVFGRDGQRMLAIGDQDAAPATSDPMVRPDHVVLSVDTPNDFPPSRAVISMRRSTGVPFTLRDKNLLATAIATLAPWLTTIVKTLALRAERRRVVRSFDQVIARHTGEAPVEDVDMSMVLVSLRKQLAQSDRVPEWVTHIRGMLRVEDMAGRLVSGDIGIFLPETALDGAQIVARRVRQLIMASVAKGEHQDIAIGVASRAAGGGSAASLVEQARASALDQGENSERQ